MRVQKFDSCLVRGMVMLVFFRKWFSEYSQAGVKAACSNQSLSIPVNTIFPP